MIAITFALPAESSGLLRRLTGRNVLKRGGMKVTAGRVSGQEVEIIHTGVGRKIAASRLIRYLDSTSPAWLISSGFAGAARSDYEVGDLLLAQNFSDAALLASARQALSAEPAHVATMFTASEMIDASAQREEIWRRHEAGAIDMETEAIAQICAGRQLRMLSFRAFSDTPRSPFPLPGEILFDIERQRIPNGRLLGHLLWHPGAIPRLLEFSRRIERVRCNLTGGLVKVLGTAA